MNDQQNLSQDRITPTFDSEGSEYLETDSLSFGYDKVENEIEVRVNNKGKKINNVNEIWEISQQTWKDLITPFK